MNSSRKKALVHESVRGAHGTFWRPNLPPDDRLGFRLAQLSHPVQWSVLVGGVVFAACELYLIDAFFPFESESRE